MANLTSVKIFPAIGIARLGNSPGLWGNLSDSPAVLDFSFARRMLVH
jgi:hypothetical protein